MVVHELCFMANLIHEVQGSDKVGQLVRRGDRRFVALGTPPVRQSRQLLGHFGIGQQLAHNPSQGAAVGSVKS